MTQAHPDIERFVRRTLGCCCADDVFRLVAIADGQSRDGTAFTRLIVGGRLLIYVLEPPAGGAVGALVGALAAQGLAERESRAYSRFRLVLASKDPGAANGEAETAFRRMVGGDDRAHLHLLSPAELPPILSSRGRR